VGSGSKKKNANSMGNYLPKDSESNARYWCINNGIYISPRANAGNASWTIDIVINNATRSSPVSYKSIQIWSKIFELYIFYYNKSNAIHDTRANKNNTTSNVVVKRNNNITSTDNTLF
jgi:hypothetical protein